ncbi:hypothetical protein JCGZ_10619 [Jatropha curcas]|uniref:Uncharacterized protein n=1 Tax=Jatropha curcas TaxID=180498 RepID=A0A067KU68_JATCU|nr:hypothetical protein JCGZ_10619 [Jatropha curcas]
MVTVSETVIWPPLQLAIHNPNLALKREKNSEGGDQKRDCRTQTNQSVVSIEDVAGKWLTGWRVDQSRKSYGGYEYSNFEAQKACFLGLQTVWPGRRPFEKFTESMPIWYLKRPEN